MENCLALGCDGVNLAAPNAPHDFSILFKHNTFVAGVPLVAHWTPTAAANKRKPIPVEAVGNIFDGTGSLLLVLGSHEKEAAPEPKELLALLPKLLAWRDRGNLYAPRSSSFVGHNYRDAAPPGPQSLADWKKFWGTADMDASEGVVRYQGGNLRTKLAQSSDKITPDDFRLRPDSAGYRAGKDK